MNGPAALTDCSNEATGGMRSIPDKHDQRTAWDKVKAPAEKRDMSKTVCKVVRLDTMIRHVRLVSLARHV